MANDNSDSAEGSHPNHSARNPACDLCREKKVRCGREKPRCRNCIGWNSEQCTYTSRPKRENETTRSAQRFDEVNARLDRMEATMARLVSLLEGGAHTPKPYRPEVHAPELHTPELRVTPAAVVSPGTQLVGGRRGSDAQYLGPSSLMSISNEAESLVTEQLRGNPAPQEKISETIGALRVSAKSAHLPFSGHKELRSFAGGVASGGVPAREEAKELFEEFASSVHPWFPIFDLDRLRTDVTRFYEPAEFTKMSEDRAWLTCFNNVCLFGLFSKLTKVPFDEPDRRYALRGQASILFYNGWAAMDNLDLFLEPRVRNIQALMTGTVCAIELSRPGLCWSLISQAARSCQALGLHRSHAGSFTPAELEERKYLFWTVYMLDKCLSLSFGRSTCLPDFDIDVSLPTATPENTSFLALIALARIQSKIYLRLYSAVAQQQPEAERARAIEELDKAMNAWWDTTQRIITPTTTDAINAYEQLELKFSFHSAMTLIHRQSRPSNTWSAAACLQHARAALQTVTDTIAGNLYAATSGMLLWLFHYYPFASFFVLFAAIVRNPEAECSRKVDYPLLKAVVEYLDRMKAENEGAAKLHSVAAVFSSVAGTFLENYQRQREERPVLKRRRRNEPLEGSSPRDEQLPVLPYDGVFITVPVSEEVQNPMDLQLTSFLRWPEEEGRDFGTLMEEPGEFMAQMEMAAERGPLEFDWVGWDLCAQSEVGAV